MKVRIGPTKDWSIEHEILISSPVKHVPKKEGRLTNISTKVVFLAFFIFFCSYNFLSNWHSSTLLPLINSPIRANFHEGTSHWPANNVLLACSLRIDYHFTFFPSGFFFFFFSNLQKYFSFSFVAIRYII